MRRKGCEGDWKGDRSMKTFFGPGLKGVVIVTEISIFVYIHGAGIEFIFLVPIIVKDNEYVYITNAFAPNYSSCSVQPPQIAADD